MSPRLAIKRHEGAQGATDAGGKTVGVGVTVGEIEGGRVLDGDTLGVEEDGPGVGVIWGMAHVHRSRPSTCTADIRYPRGHPVLYESWS